jgi:RNA polymerase sigma-70 factor (ECF subfamily)
MSAPETPDDVRSGGSTSRSLIADARLADPAAWERLVRLYAPLVASWCRRWGVAGQDVVDVMQDVFSAVAHHLHRFRKDRPADTFRGWLATITRNKIRDHLRRRAEEPNAAGGSAASHRMSEVLDPHAESDEPLPADELLLDDLLRTALDSIRGEFHEQTWKAFWGVVVDGRATADVAADLGMKPGAVRVAKSRVLLRLRRELGDAPS